MAGSRTYAIGLANGIEITVIYTDREPDERHIMSACQRGGPSPMSDDTSGTTSKTEPKTGWRRLRSMTDEEIHAVIIDDPDAQPTDEGFWKDARLVMPRRKETVTMRLDADLLEWFRKERGYQTRINAILRAYMNVRVDSR
jgi:uncharacterized protein (DUF4415 family)